MAGGDTPGATQCIVCGAAQALSFRYREHDYRRCCDCGLLSTYPIPNEGEIEAHYESKFRSGNYKLLLDFSNEYRRVYQGIIDKLSCAIGGSKDGFRGLKVLDIGCFTGEFLDLLQELGADCYGIELQQEAVEIANGKIPGRVFKADVYGGDFPQLEFDVVTLLGVVEHLVDPQRMIARAFDLLRPGGVILIETPDSGSILAKALKGLWPPCAPVEHIHLFSKRALKSGLDRCGFGDIVFCAHIKFLPFTYVFRMLESFGPEYKPFLKPVHAAMPGFMRGAPLPFYVGEMIAIARKKQQCQNSVS